MKLKTARTLKWNTIDRVSSQVLYAVVGVVLANLLSKEDFGLVGALLVFQAFGILFVDSGFGSALLRKKDPTERDWSTVFWFNLAVALTVYIVLFLCAPLIAEIFQDDRRLIPLSKVMFISFVLNGLGLVQTTRLMKRMEVKQIAIANTVGLTVSGGVGVWLAFAGFGPWAIVWQTVTLSAVKTGWLWITSKWLPRAGFHIDSLEQIWRVGFSVFSSSALNTFFLYIYSFVIGAFYNLASLGVYTQADKWSKMGSASISQVLTASFVPLLAKFQDDGENFRRYVRKINRFTGFILFPVMVGIAVLGEPLFHTLFGNKWDSAIPLFQILTVRGIFVVLISLYNNYLLALGYARKLFMVEVVKDVMIFAAILATVWGHSVELLVWGQLAASLATYFVVLRIVSRSTGVRIGEMLADLMPFTLSSLCAGAIAIGIMWMGHGMITSVSGLGYNMLSLAEMAVMGIAGVAIYTVLMRMIKAPEMPEATSYLFGRFRKKS